MVARDKASPPLRAAARLLGIPALEDDEQPLGVAAVEAREGTWSFRIGGAFVPPFVLVVTPLGPGPREVYRETARLGVSYQSESFTAAMGRVIDGIAKRLARVTPEQLARWFPVEIEAPPEDEGPLHFGSVRGRRDPGLNRAWNEPDAWKWFLAAEELRQAADEVIRYDTDTLRVEHGDYECQYVSPRGFVCFPWRGQASPAAPEPDADPLARPGAPAPSGSMDRLRRDGLFTNLADEHVIDGAAELLEDLLDGIQDTLDPDAVFLNITCVPEVIGDDVRGVLQRQGRRLTCPLVVKTQKEGDPYERNEAYARDALLSSETEAPDDPSVNLVGFPAGQATDEIAAWLEARGVRVNARFIPRITRSDARRFRAAAAQVWYPNQDWEGLYERLLGDLPVKRVEAVAPFGVQGTVAFVHAIAEALGLPELGDAIDDEAARIHDGPLARLRRQAAEHVVGFVVQAHQLPRLIEPRRSWGIPLVAVVRELGFDVRLAVASESDARGAWWGEAAALVGDERALRHLRSVEERDAWIREARPSALFSDFFFEERLLRQGAVPFSQQLFELGLPGAIRTGERLLQRCRMDLARRYQACLDEGGPDDAP
jgi:hypothetical protein